MKILKQPIIVQLKDIFEDVKLIAVELKARLVHRRNLNQKVNKEGSFNYTFQLENSEKEEGVYIAESKHFLKKCNENLEFILRTFLKESKKINIYKPSEAKAIEL